MSFKLFARTSNYSANINDAIFLVTATEKLIDLQLAFLTLLMQRIKPHLDNLAHQRTIGLGNDIPLLILKYKLLHYVSSSYPSTSIRSVILTARNSCPYVSAIRWRYFCLLDAPWCFLEYLKYSHLTQIWRIFRLLSCSRFGWQIHSN